MENTVAVDQSGLLDLLDVMPTPTGDNVMRRLLAAILQLPSRPRRASSSAPSRTCPAMPAPTTATGCLSGWPQSSLRWRPGTATAISGRPRWTAGTEALVAVRSRDPCRQLRLPTTSR